MKYKTPESLTSIITNKFNSHLHIPNFKTFYTPLFITQKLKTHNSASVFNFTNSPKNSHVLYPRKQHYKTPQFQTR